MESESPRVERSNSMSRGGGKAMGGGMNMMEEMARKLAARCVLRQKLFHDVSRVVVNNY